MNDKTFAEAIWNTDPSNLDNPSACVQGHASFDADRGISLEIPLGTLLDHEPVDGVITYGEDPLEADCVYGISQTGSHLIITNLFESHRSMTCPGFSRQTLRGRELIASKRPMDPNPLVTTFMFTLVGLREWVGISPTRHSVRYDDCNHLEEMNFRYAAADIPDVVLLDEDGVKVFVECVFTDKGGHIPQYEFGFITDYRVVISFDEPLSLQEVLDDYSHAMWPVHPAMSAPAVSFRASTFSRK